MFLPGHRSYLVDGSTGGQVPQAAVLLLGTYLEALKNVWQLVEA